MHIVLVMHFQIDVAVSCIVLQMARKITRCVEKRTALVKRTRDTLVEYYHMFSKWSPFTDCCVLNVKQLKYNEKFKAFVSIQLHRVFAC